MKSRRSAFMLVEALLALAVLAVAFGALLGLGAQGARGTRLTRDVVASDLALGELVAVHGGRPGSYYRNLGLPSDAAGWGAAHGRRLAELAPLAPVPDDLERLVLFRPAAAGDGGTVTYLVLGPGATERARLDEVVW